ncbi:M35 family metallo-endopeptidase [Xanthomonas hortorum]|uniref:M35 family metallo-endopeptidase n=1 Tax=Xanthomonas hortorum pv. vitians TaxID=83224 RepID=A0A6V7DJY8_9XANT|nr:M35 family metallo-endopeptidase [Xanthomonas hortorum]APP86902.1 protease [Xanthomonas hortorum pv. gardneri]ASW48439.1 protease [Xanthomonas hortorum]MCC8496494.1 protease [Xanthomonas hortorum pv. gardneri]MCE4296316.1 M35 family metallo-endopeptidase [Xanthomonas hortorum pv. vitians]MCE4301217.1 M35 family metallo-endopeptidase [Xanthomonas hortorum pv. vitians]
MKNVFLASFAAGTLAVVGVLGSAQAQSVRGPVPLTIELAPVADQAGRHQGKIAVTVTNNGSQIARVPTYQLPLKSLDNGILDVSRDGTPVNYTGRLVKRGLPKAADFTILKPGQSVQGEVDLAGAYDLSTSGNYTIQVRSSLQYASLSDGSLMKAANGEPAVATSTPLTVWLDGARRGVQRQLAVGPTAVVNGINYLNCSTTRTSQAGSAVTAARAYSQNARNYLNAGSTGARYTTWFGAYNASRYSRVSQNFVAIDNALDQNNGQIIINCNCTDSAYAYVYANAPYEIYVCNAFWSAPTQGTDSKAGTLVHEMSHFTAVAGTQDRVYGQSGARSLAISNPAQAITNADSHEYFAENTPAQN